MGCGKKIMIGPVAIRRSIPGSTARRWIQCSVVIGPKTHIRYLNRRVMLLFGANSQRTKECGILHRTAGRYG